MPEQFSFSPIYSEDVVDRTDAEGAAPGGQQLPRFTSGGAQVTPSSAPPPDAQPTGDSEPLNLPEQGGVRKTGLQARIDRLVRQKHQAASERDTLRNEVAGLREQLSGLQSALTSVTRQPAAQAPSRAYGVDDGEGSGTPALVRPAQPSGGGAADISGLIRDEIQKAISPLVQRNAIEEKMTALRAAHEASFNEAAEFFPDLRDQKSELRQTFNALYDSRTDIAQLPDAPMLLAHMARGAVADQRRVEQRSAERKRGAALHVPQPVVDPSGLSETKIKASAVAAAKERMRSGLSTLADYKIIRDAGREAANRLRTGQE